MKSIEDQIKSSAQKALKSESKSIDLLATNLPQDLPGFILGVIETKGRVIISGVGKSGHIGKDCFNIGKYWHTKLFYSPN